MEWEKQHLIDMRDAALHAIENKMNAEEAAIYAWGMGYIWAVLERQGVLPHQRGEK